jgi:hypothetical protein
MCSLYVWVEFKSNAFDALSIISNVRSGLKSLKSVWCAVRHLPLQLQYSPHIRHLLAFKPIAVHMPFDVAKLFGIPDRYVVVDGLTLLLPYVRRLVSWTWR